MDPLSISASIAGLLVAAVQVSHLLRDFINNTKQAPSTARHTLMETTGIYVCLNQLESFLSGKQKAARSRRSLIMIEQVIILLTDCVSIFSELEQLLETLKPDSCTIRTIDKMKWSFKEKALSKLLTRLQGSKTSLNLILTILTCTSVDHAEESTRTLTTGIQLLLKSNLNMSRRLRNIERMHPALAASSCPSKASSIFSLNLLQSEPRPSTDSIDIHFEEALEKSPAYKRAGFNRLMVSKSSSTISPGPSFLSGLSLGDVDNVSAVALPISSRELWNHHRYVAVISGDNAKAGTQALDAWYNPPPTKSAFIRTAYFNGQYTNQYAQPKFTGHLIYRRFSVGNTPHSAPVFTEGALLPTIMEKKPPDQEYVVAELEDTAACRGLNLLDADGRCSGAELRGSRVMMDDAARWRQSLIRLLETTC
ncbi:MAG: hypothetical protein Q9195_002756 [Heterodermia aff. obscurata]